MDEKDGEASLPRFQAVIELDQEAFEVCRPADKSLSAYMAGSKEDFQHSQEHHSGSAEVDRGARHAARPVVFIVVRIYVVCAGYVC